MFYFKLFSSSQKLERVGAMSDCHMAPSLGYCFITSTRRPLLEQNDPDRYGVAGLTVSVADLVTPPQEAEMVTVVTAETLDVAIVNLT